MEKILSARFLAQKTFLTPKLFQAYLLEFGNEDLEEVRRLSMIYTLSE